MSKKEDFGASHDFTKSYFSRRNGNEKNRKIPNELRISHTVYMKLKHLKAVDEYSKNSNIGFSQAFDYIIQMGIAYIHLLAYEKAEAERQNNAFSVVKEP